MTQKAVAEAEGAIPASAPADTIEGLFAALEGPLLGYARRLMGELSLAEDMVQEAFLRLHAHFAEVREPKRWLFRTVHNLALNQHRRAAKVVPLPDPAGPGPEVELATEPGPGPDEALAHAEQLDRLQHCLEGLDERSRNLIRLKFHEGLSYQQISDRTGLKTGHVGYLLHHAIKGLATAMARNEVLT
ncbi:MAG: RNA polymerase sigma factor [Verrucomicrobiales bacterium]|nr:RNA polymerase sigma factor [Verrucomicrobiales bacterium]MCP5527056.1 RNA polymerase sigma factor [Verrucomicrobiales bacterium]